MLKAYSALTEEIVIERMSQRAIDKAGQRGWTVASVLFLSDKMSIYK